MTTIGYATLQIIPSLDGVSAAVDKQLGGTLQASGKKGGKALAKGVGEGLKDLESAVDSAGKSYQKLRDKASDALGKVRTEEAKLAQLRSSGAGNDRIVATEERLATARRNSTRATREAWDSHKLLESAQKDLAGSSDDLGRRFGGLSSIAGTVGGALGAAGAVAGGAALVGIGALAAGVAAATRELYDLGTQFDDLSDNLQIKTGLSGTALDGLKKSVENLGTTDVPDTFANIGDTAAEVTRNLHLTGQPLEDITSRLANLKRLGVDVNVRALSKAFRGFGVDTKGQVPALNGLFKASQDTGLSIDDMLASVTKFGAPLRALGFSFGESAALVTTFEDAGLDADKSLAGLSKGLVNFSKDGKAGSDALRDAITQIKGLADAGNDPGALDLSNKLFGAKGGAAFFDAIKNGSLDLQSLSDSLSTTSQDINDVSDKTADWSEKWQDLKNKVSVALEPLATGVFNGVNEQLGNLADAVVKNKDVIISGLENIADTAVSVTEVSVRSMGLFSEGLGQMIAPIGDVLGALTDANAAVQSALGRDDIAKQLREDAQGYYGLGEGLTAFGRSAKDVDLSGLRNAIHSTADEMKRASDNAALLKTGITTLPDGKTVVIKDTTPENIQHVKDLGYTVTNLPDGHVAISVQYMYNGAPISLDQLKTPIRVPATPGGSVPTTGGGRAAGGAIFGAGTATSDSIPAWLSNGEHVWTAKEVERAGGHGAMYRMRDAVLNGYSGGGGIMMAVPWGVDPHGSKDAGSSAGPFGPWWDMDWMPPEHPEKVGPGKGRWWSHGPTHGGKNQTGAFAPPIGKNRLPRPGDPYPGMLPDDEIKIWGFSGGGAVGPDVLAAGELVGTAYSQATRHDCSGMVARVIDRTLGMPETGLMSTKNAEEWLKARGFKPGIGGKGQLSVGWYDHGPNPNDGHMAMTLSDGSNAEAGGGVGDIFQIGGGAAGASDPEFDRHMFLPTLYGEGPAGSSSASPFAGGSAVAAVTGGSAPAASSSGGGGGSSGGGSASISLPSAFSGLAGIGLDGLGIKTKVGPDSPERTLDLGGVAAAAVGGQISSALDVFGIGDSPPFLQAASKLISGISIGGGSSAAPLSATSTATGVPADAAGNAHGTRAGQQPGPTYNITARDTEDAFVKAQRIERERAASKLSRF